MTGDLAQIAISELQDWYAGEARSDPKRPPSKSALLAAIFVLELMREAYPLDRAEHVTKGNQLSRISLTGVERIFLRFGETRPLPRMAGRTTRGTANFAFSLVDRLAQIPEFQVALEAQRLDAIERLQEQLLRFYQRDYLDKGRIRIDASVQLSFETIVGEILRKAERNAGPVAQHLIGAKLALRFPDTEVENYHSSAGDQQTGRPGDFIIGSTVFHVTMAPTELLIDKCKENIRDGYRVYLLVPSSRIQMAKGLIENADLQGANLQGKISVESSIESFVGQNLDEIGAFRQDTAMTTLSRLLHIYNERVAAVGEEGSMLVEIPRSLQNQ